MRISVFGIGYVGAVSAACLARDGHTVLAVDTSQQKVETINAGRSPIVEAGLGPLIEQAVAGGRLRATTDGVQALRDSQLSFVCVGTPSLANGNLDLTQVVRVCEVIGRGLAGKPDFHAVVVRSTMLPGSLAGVVAPVLEGCSGKKAGRDFGTALYPEFLREGSAIRDYDQAGTVILGVDDERTLALVREAIAKAPGREIVVGTATAEMIKYANNAWHATKIVFANEIGALCKALGLDGHRVMDALCADTRLNVSAAYLRPGFAFGGSCLPKDLRALLHRARSLDVRCPMIASLLPSNEEQVRRAFEMVQAAGNRRVGLIGLAFKSGTDDLRESPAVELAERLFGKGYDIRIFDRDVNLARLTGANLAFIQARIPHLARLLSDDLHAVAAHGDTLVLVHGQFGEGLALPALRADQILIDLARLADVQRPAGGRYEGICW
ncbi:nucleotide sugar dehydrogenase [Caldovatus aquaticus]|uniref:UDP-glucose 6-dehydrogenase n=1 Tax=Caldovatus aquaticus TaxID=2865671 RepID=A0ABS7F6N8_9PROT|nr:nucleotide sugar dehydrogenase [Caldovatus aquaticus]MBW8271277.1 nucleotide sugar dehydrogenase [Caldovatus aquaticus]